MSEKVYYPCYLMAGDTLSVEVDHVRRDIQFNKNFVVQDVPHAIRIYFAAVKKRRRVTTTTAPFLWGLFGGVGTSVVSYKTMWVMG